MYEGGRALSLAISVNGAALPPSPIDRPGMFVIEADVPAAARYTIEFRPSATFSPPPPDVRAIGVNIGMVRLIPREA